MSIDAVALLTSNAPSRGKRWMTLWVMAVLPVW